VLRNHVPPTELKKVANKNHETFWDPPNLKSFGGEVANFQSSGKDLFFLECSHIYSITRYLFFFSYSVVVTDNEVKKSFRLETSTT